MSCLNFAFDSQSSHTCKPARVMLCRSRPAGFKTSVAQAQLVHMCVTLSRATHVSNFAEQGSVINPVAPEGDNTPRRLSHNTAAHRMS